MTVILKHPVVALFVVVHFVFCAAFLVLREPAISFEERERARLDLGHTFESSVDPIMFIAGRPLHGWNEWHGGEVIWIKVFEVLNLPAFVATVTVGHIPIAIYRATGSGRFVHDTWIRAFVFAVFSVAQWVVIGSYFEKKWRARAAAV